MASTSTPTRHRSNLSIDAQKTPRASTAATSSSAASSTSGAAAASAIAKGNNRSAAKDLLRDYYGLNKAGGGASPSKAASGAADPLNIDSPSFSAQAYIQNLLSTATLAQLLQASTELSTSISDLEGERQSLVYNHHHELIDASVTISKMKVRAESLDTTLEQLKAGLSRCSELNNGLRLPVGDKSAGATSTSAADKDVNEKSTPTVPRIDWQTALGTLIDLPFVMRNATPEEAQRLWGTYEPVLRQWKDAGVQGIDEIEAECRQSLNGNS